MHNKMRMSRLISDREDDLFSGGEIEDDEDNYINKKQLIHLENDKSVTIDESLENDREENYYLRMSRRKESPVKNNKISHHDELLKFIGDTSDIFSDNVNTANPLINMNKPNWNFMNSTKNLISPVHSKNKSEIVFTTNKFELFLPGDFRCSNSNNNTQNYEKDKLFTLQSQTQSQASFRVSNNYKEKFELIEGKYKDLVNNYNSIIEGIKEWQMYYIKIFNSLNMPIPTSNAYSEIFNDKYKDAILNIIDDFVNKTNKFENLNVVKEISGQILNIKTHIKIQLKIEQLAFKIIGKNSVQIGADRRNSNTLMVKKLNLFENLKIDYSLYEFSIFNTEVKKVIAPKQVKTFNDDDYNYLAPFSSRNKNIKKKNSEFEIVNSQIKDNKLSISSNINYEVTCLNTQVKNKKLILFSFSLNFNSIKKTQVDKQIETDIEMLPKKCNSEAQTKLNNFDIDKLCALNEEYSEQLVIYKNEKDKLEIYYKSEVENLKKELNNKGNITIDSQSYHPEMIPPDQTFRIFLRIFFLI